MGDQKMQRAGAFAATVARRGAAGPAKNGTGGVFESRLHGNLFDPWQHRTTNLSVAETVRRGKINAGWLMKSGMNNTRFLPWGAAGVLLGYMMIQDALPSPMKIL